MIVSYYHIFIFMDSSDYILLSELNDFIFCPRSIYWHHIYGKYEKSLYQTTFQTRGSHIHDRVDKAKYSSRKDILQGIPVVSHKYGIIGKIDSYNAKTGILTERKKKISKIFKWYEWQLYGQYFCLTEMWYVVTGLQIYSYDDNKNYKIPLPNSEEEKNFQKILESFKNFSLEKNFQKNPEKCKNCIYKNLCDIS